MKIQYKGALTMTLFGAVIVTLLSLGYDILSYRIVIDKETSNIKNISREVAQHVNSHLKQKAAVAITLSSAPLIKDALLKSNAEFTVLSAEERKQEIDSRNQQWINTVDSNDPFIQAYMGNPVAEYLKYQQIIMPREYGEIFLTNRYGVIIATTGKLTTLAHRHKYWWLACFDNGQGRIFLDDRGFDSSVQGYVLGVVIPIKNGNEVIGILKCNVNIMGELTDIVQEFGRQIHCSMKIVRTGGLIISERDVVPLSTRLNEALIKPLAKKVSGTITITENNKTQLVAFSPVQITTGSKKFGFGGHQESIDHIKGNSGEAWHVVISQREEDAMVAAHKATSIIILIGAIITLLAAAVANLLGKLAAKPIVELATIARNIGEGDLDSRIDMNSNDEIGNLAKSLNKMAQNLQESMASRDELIFEVEQRKKAEEKLHILSTTDELTGADNRRAFNTKLHTNIGRAKRYNEPLSLLLLDIDHFKKVNDSYGHDVGDMVLKSLVCALTESIRQEDIVARWGGEEFSILLPQTGKDAALQQAERLRIKISDYDFPTVSHITVSIGCTELQVQDTPSSLIKRADKALYQAKEAGRNIVKFC